MLIVLGLMLATLIITAAFITGDTLSNSIRTVAIEGLGEIDEMVQLDTRSTESSYFRISRYESLAKQLARYSLVDRLIPAIYESVPVVNVTRRSSLRSITIMGIPPEDIGVLPWGEITDSANQPFSLDALQANEVYINAAAADVLGAAPGDELELYIGPHPKDFIIRAISGLGEEPRMLVTLHQAQRMFNKQSMINTILVSNLGDEFGGVFHSQAVTAHLRGLLSDPLVASRLYASLSRDPTVAQALRKAAEREEGNIQVDLLAMADGLEAGELSPATRSLLADAGLGNRVLSILADIDWGSEPLRNRLSRMFGDLSDLAVDDIKRDTLDTGELAASAYTTIFIVSGLFGITAGLVLIFLIFVLLAAERKSEMGMARAVGAQRGRLVEMFVFEGTAYALAAAAVGVILGVGTGFIIALTLEQNFASVGIDIRPSISIRSLVVSYSLGMLVTFTTVLISAANLPERPAAGTVPDYCGWLPSAIPPATHPGAAKLYLRSSGQPSTSGVVGIY
jgi:ABC-type lipoprotein release transport system permease subunit